MFRVASASPNSASESLRSRQSTRPESRSEFNQSRVIPFPVASASVDENWQSVGQAAFNVLRNLRARPTPSLGE